LKLRGKFCKRFLARIPLALERVNVALRPKEQKDVSATSEGANYHGGCLVIHHDSSPWISGEYPCCFGSHLAEGR
jgi:hypothetical protein